MSPSKNSSDLNCVSGTSPSAVLSAENLHAISVAMERIFNEPSPSQAIGKAAA